MSAAVFSPNAFSSKTIAEGDALIVTIGTGQKVAHTCLNKDGSSCKVGAAKGSLVPANKLKKPVVLTDVGRYLVHQYQIGNPMLRAHLDADAMALLISKLMTDMTAAKKVVDASTKAEHAKLGFKQRPSGKGSECSNCGKITLSTYTFGGKEKFVYCSKKDCKVERDAHFLRLNPGGAAAPVHYVVAAAAPAPAKSSGNPLLTQTVEQLQALYEKSSNSAIKAAINAELSRRRPNTPVHRESPPASPSRVADMSSDELLMKSIAASNDAVRMALEAAYEKALARENAAKNAAAATTAPLSIIEQQLKEFAELSGGDSAAASAADSEADVDEEYVVPRGGGGKSKRRAVADDE